MRAKFRRIFDTIKSDRTFGVLAFLLAVSVILVAAGVGALIDKQESAVALLTLGISGCLLAIPWLRWLHIPSQKRFAKSDLWLWSSIPIFYIVLGFRALFYDPGPSSNTQYLVDQPWLQAQVDAEAHKAEIEAEYQDAQDTVLEDMAGSIPESESNLAVVSRDGRVVRVNKLSGAWCVLIDNPSNPQSYFSCSEIDKRAQRVREQKSLASRIRHFLSIDLRTVLRNALVIITDKVRGNWRSERSISSRIAPPGGLPQRRVFCGMSAMDKMAGRKLDNRS